MGFTVLPHFATVAAKSLQSCPTLWDPRDCSPSGSSVHGILQTRILEWVAMPSFRGSSQSRDRTHISYVSCTGRQAHEHHQGSHNKLKTENIRGNGSPLKDMWKSAQDVGVTVLQETADNRVSGLCGFIQFPPSKVIQLIPFMYSTVPCLVQKGGEYLSTGRKR